MGEARLIYPIPANLAVPPLPMEHRKHGARENAWTYRDPAGLVLFHVLRFPDPERGKVVLPYTLWEASAGRLEWRNQGLPAPRPLYNLDQLAVRPGAPVIVCEGEKAADAAGRLFPEWIPTASGSATSAGKADWTRLRGRKVIVWPDQDEAGAKYAAEVLRRPYGIAASIAVVQVPGSFPQKWDLADPTPDGWDHADLSALLERATPPNESQPDPQKERPSGPFLDLNVREMLSREPKPLRWVVPGLLPLASEGILASPPGLGKSRLALEVAVRLAGGLPIFGKVLDPTVPRGAVFVGCEDGPEELDRRLHSLVEMLKPEGLDTECLFRNLRIRTPNWNQGAPSLSTDWPTILNAAEGLTGGCGLIVADTLSALNGGRDENSVSEMSGALNAIKALADSTGACVLAIHHLGKGYGDQGGRPLPERLSAEAVRGSSSIIGRARFVLVAGMLNGTEAGKAGLDEEAALNGHYVALSLSKCNAAERGPWLLLDRVPRDEPGEGFLRINPNGEHHLAPLRSKASAERLERADQVLLAVRNAGGGLRSLNRIELARTLWPDAKNPSNQANKAVGSLRRLGYLDDQDRITPAGEKRCHAIQGEAPDQPAAWMPDSQGVGGSKVPRFQTPTYGTVEPRNLQVPSGERGAEHCGVGSRSESSNDEGLSLVPCPAEHHGTSRNFPVPADSVARF